MTGRPDVDHRRDDGIPPAHLAWAGGPLGRFAVPATRGVDRVLSGAAPVVAGAVLVVIVALLRLQHCLAHGWSGKEPFHRMCYSDLANSVAVADLGKGAAAYLTGGVPLDQPPLSGLEMSLLGGFVSSPDVLTGQRWFIGAWAVIAVVLLALMAARARTIGGHPWADPAQIVLSPVVALTVLLSPDILGVGLSTLGLWAWTWRRPWQAGVLLGLAVAARTYPLILLAVIVAVTLAHRDRREDAPQSADLRPLLLGAAGTVAGLGLLFVASLPTFVEAWRGWWSAPTGPGSVWHLLTLAGSPLPAWAATVFAVIGWVAAGVLVRLLLGSVRRRPPIAAVALVAVAVVLVTGKSFPVQSSLWLVPLIALTGLRWRDHLIWASAEALHFAGVWLHLGGLGDTAKGLPVGWYAVTVLLRLAAVAWVARQAWETAISGQAPRAAILDRLPSACGKLPSPVGDSAYPPVTERP